MAREEEIIEFASAAAFEEWLAAHHSACPGIWLKLRKKGRGVDCLDYAQALDVALCYGWIDGQKDKFDDSRWLQRFTPRTPRSRWSKVNREKVTALIEQGRMRAPGMAEAERAKADGRWDAAYAGQKTAIVPEDLAAALAASPAAAEFFGDSRQPEPVLDPLPGAGCQEAGNPGAPDPEVRRDVWPSIRRSTPDLAAPGIQPLGQGDYAHVHDLQTQLRMRLQ